MKHEIHPVRLNILYTLRRSPSARYRDLLRPTGLETDRFKYHLAALCADGLVVKDTDGSYNLTLIGKEYANRLDREPHTIRKQPKLSVAVVVSRQSSEGQTEYLLHQRRRHPFWGYWGLVSGPVPWGVSLEQAAADEVLKQCGLVLRVARVSGFVRARDLSDSVPAMLLEDKLFAVVSGETDSNTDHNWSGGHNEWLTAPALEAKQPLFAHTKLFMTMAAAGFGYEYTDTVYETGAY